MSTRTEQAIETIAETIAETIDAHAIPRSHWVRRAGPARVEFLQHNGIGHAPREVHVKASWNLERIAEVVSEAIATLPEKDLHSDIPTYLELTGE